MKNVTRKIQDKLAYWSSQLKTEYRKLKKQARTRWEALPSSGTMRIALMSLIAFILVAMVYLAQSSNAALIARDLRVKQLKIQEVERENAQLRYEIAALASPSAIEQRARKLGLGPARKVVYAEMPWIQPPPAMPSRAHSVEAWPAAPHFPKPCAAA